MCPLLALVLIGFFFVAAVNSTNEENKAGGSVVRTVKQSILLRCLWVEVTNTNEHTSLLGDAISNCELLTNMI